MRPSTRRPRIVSRVAFTGLALIADATLTGVVPPDSVRATMRLYPNGEVHTSRALLAVAALALGVALGMGCGSSQPSTSTSASADPLTTGDSETTSAEEASASTEDVGVRATTARDLYALVVALTSDPTAQVRLAPNLVHLHHGEVDTVTPVEDTSRELAWIRDDVVFVEGDTDAMAEDGDASTMSCDVAALRCEIAQPGGTTTLTFSRVDDERVVLAQFETEDP